jgi:hypothetical protein
VTRPGIAALAAAIGLAFSAGAPGASISKVEYEATRKNIASDFKTAKIGCEPMPAHVRDACMAEVKGREDVASAELEAAYDPGPRTRYGLRIAKAHADHAVARERCDYKAENAKEGCLKEAEAAAITAKSDAKVQLTAAEAKAPDPVRAGSR